MKWRSLEESSQIDIRPLREIYAQRKALIEKYVPTETQDVHARVVNELKARGLAAQALAVRKTAPVFDLKDHNGKSVSSAALLAKGPLVIFFIRGRWCPFCVGQVEAMNLIASEIEQSGASLVAISPQTVQQSYFMHDQHKLRFPLLSDTGNSVARQFALVYKVPDYQQALYKRVFVNLPHANGDESWELPIPAIFILDREGTVLYSFANEDYTERPEPLDILQKLNDRPS
ncbi:MAG TPA: peroxiredoxin-like family protein [Terriglobales bacterium]|jgi:peroxiredoxin